MLIRFSSPLLPLAAACLGAWTLLTAAPALATTPSVGPTRSLSLYGVELLDLPADRFVIAATEAGLQPIGTVSRHDQTFDARPAGVPNLHRMRLVTADGFFVMAQFRLEGHDTEKLRRMLASKYGPPRASGPWCRDGDFTAQYVPDCRYEWRFAGGMRLVFNKGFRETHLSYYSEPRFKALEQQLERQAQCASRDKARELDRNF